MASKPKEETFFTQLKSVGRVLDKQLPSLQEQVANPPENTAVHQLRAKRAITDMRADLKTIKTDANKDRKRAEDDANFLDQLLSLSESLLTKTQKQLSETEDYFKQYGYKPYVPEPAKTEDIKTETGEEQKDVPVLAENATFTVFETNDQDGTKIEPATKTEPATRDVMRTPKLEDRGISKSTMQFLRSASKKPQLQKEPFQAPQVGRQHLPSVPDEFKHDGILVTPSLLGGRKSCDESLCGHALHLALASPVPPQMMTPGLKLEKQADLMFPDPAAKLPFDKNPSDSPPVPTFQTPGLSISKQVAMIAPRQAIGQVPGEKKAVVGLFKEEPGVGSGQGPGDSRARTGNQTFVKEEPVEPDLTYSLETMSEMTGVYSIVPKPPKASTTTSSSMPKAPESLAERLLQDKQNVTPPTPELLSDRLSKIAMSKGDNPGAPPSQKWKSKWTSNEMPPPPKFLSKQYSWMNNENKPPN